MWHCIQYDLIYALRPLGCGIGVFAAMAIPLDPEDEGIRFLLNIWHYSSTGTASHSNCIFKDTIFCRVLLAGWMDECLDCYGW